MGKVLAAVIVICALATGAAVYYLQVYAYYDRIAPTGADVMLTARDTGLAEGIAYSDFSAIDANSSPIRYRACFATPLTPEQAAQVYEPYPAAEPLQAPGWFDCFDAADIGEALEAGEAQAFLGERDVHYGIDRVVALLPGGRGFVWHQINRCGEVVFSGKPAPDDCPPPPDTD